MYQSAQQLKAQDDQFISLCHSTNELTRIQNILQVQSPLISINEINELRQLIVRASVGEYFLIQSGDCTEYFYEGDRDTAYEQLEFIQQLAEFFHKKTGYGVIRVGQIAGQYAKLRGNQYVVSDPIYREIDRWNHSGTAEQKIYRSHDAFILYYEQAVTRLDEQTGLYYNRATHFPLLGMRIANSMQHINYFKKIANPIAIKIDPNTSIKNLIKCINELDPDYLPGRITLIPRLGAQHVHSILPQLIEAVKKTQRTVLWSCDPMHGNTETINSGIMTRKLSNIVDEIKSSFLIHRQMGSALNAIHLEATHQDVVECVNYESFCCELASDVKINDKSLLHHRLNYEQTMHVIRLVAKHFIDG